MLQSWAQNLGFERTAGVFGDGEGLRRLAFGRSQRHPESFQRGRQVRDRGHPLQLVYDPRWCRKTLGSRAQEKDMDTMAEGLTILLAAVPTQSVTGAANL